MKTHLHTMSQILPLFVAIDDVHYAKSAPLYLHLMTELQQEYLWLYLKFSGRSCCMNVFKWFWYGLWSDTVIKQILMWGLKSRVVAALKVPAIHGFILCTDVLQFMMPWRQWQAWKHGTVNSISTLEQLFSWLSNIIRLMAIKDWSQYEQVMNIKTMMAYVAMMQKKFASTFN